MIVVAGRIVTIVAISGRIAIVFRIAIVIFISIANVVLKAITAVVMFYTSIWDVQAVRTRGFGRFFRLLCPVEPDKDSIVKVSKAVVSASEISRTATSFARSMAVRLSIRRWSRPVEIVALRV